MVGIYLGVALFPLKAGTLERSHPASTVAERRSLAVGLGLRMTIEGRVCFGCASNIAMRIMHDMRKTPARGRRINLVLMVDVVTSFYFFLPAPLPRLVETLSLPTSEVPLPTVTLIEVLPRLPARSIASALMV